MNLKGLQQIQRPYPATRIIKSIGFISLFLVILYSCTPTEKKEKREVKLIPNVMQGIGENLAYQKVGLLKLSDYGLFQEPLKNLQPTQMLLPYDLNTPLFTDYSSKLRFIHIPEGESAEYREREVLDFPDGTILVKNFFYSETQLEKGETRIIETRLLIKENGSWIALPYIWNEEQSDAFLEITGGSVPVRLSGMDQPFEYLVPTMLQCKSCHELNGDIMPIGPTVRQLNRNYPYAQGVANQLQKMVDMQWLENHPDNQKWPKIAKWDDKKNYSVNERARAYLDINCGHCHRPGGPGKNSGLDLTVYAQGEHSLGIFKAPVAAGAGSGGLNYDIVPGAPEKSILLYRMESNDPGIKMPELGRGLIHKEGIELIEKWIKSLK